MMCFEEWSDSILSNCGHYHSKPVRNVHSSVGDFRLRRRHDVDIAEMKCESGRIDRIDRHRADIRRDDREYLFLLLWQSGGACITHNGREEMLTPGDSLLMDSTRPAELLFQGNQAAFVSVHLPRALYLEGRSHQPATGRRVERSHPLRASLINLLSDGGAADAPTDYLFDFVALMFRMEDPDGDAGRFRDRLGRFRFISDTIDRHVMDPDFSIEQLAGLVHMSRRQLQRDFSDNGTTFTRFLSERRMRLVASHLRRAAHMNKRVAISELAYRSGFSDLSHFNRGFRKSFGMSPGSYHADCVAKTTER